MDSTHPLQRGFKVKAFLRASVHMVQRARHLLRQAQGSKQALALTAKPFA
jgi:hypothetical protein